jgi:ubiquinone/menaquinone biosynthesis C-methylase UbiE
MDTYIKKQREHYQQQYAMTGAHREFDFNASLWEWCKWRPLMLIEPILAKMEGASCVTICAGAGRELPLLARHGIQITATDITIEQLIPLKEEGVIQNVQEQNAEHLNFEDDSFDYGFVNAGLHHLQHPHAGLLELLRCARKGVIFIEAQDSVLHAVMRRLGRAGADFEPAGNYVYRWTRREVEKISLSAHIYGYGVKTYFNPVLVPMRGITGRKMRFGKAMLEVSNKVLAPVGNVFIGMLVKRQPTSEEAETYKKVFSNYHDNDYPWNRHP